MKKSILVALLLISLTGAFADSKTTVLTGNSCSNLLAGIPFSGSALVTAITVAAPAANVGAVTLFDSPTNSLTYAAPAYSTYRAYPTNIIFSWTDFQGRSASFTNVGQYTLSNYVAAATVSYPVRSQISAPTNTTVNIPNVSYHFLNGMWATNTSAGATTVTIQYQQ